MIEEIRRSIIYLKNVEGYIESCINQINVKQQELSSKEQEYAKLISENNALKKEIEELKINILMNKQEIDMVEEALCMNAYIADNYFIYYFPEMETIFLYYD